MTITIGADVRSNGRVSLRDTVVLEWQSVKALDHSYVLLGFDLRLQ